MNRLLGQDRRAEQRIQSMLLDRLSLAQEKRMSAEIARTMRSMASQFETTGDVQVDPDHQRRVSAILRSGWRTSIEVYGGRILSAAKSRHGPAWTKAPDPDPLWSRLFTEFLAKWGALKIVQVSDTTRDQVRTLVERGRRDGLGTEAIAKSIRSKSTQVGGLRAHVIARTETHGAANYSMLNTASETGLHLNKEWISAQDERTRETPFDHLGADGETVPIDGLFIRTGEPMTAPGDPAGSAGNVIMCRCAQGFVEAD